MPFAPHTRMTMSGTIGSGSGVESFQYGLNLKPYALGGFALTPSAQFFTDLASDAQAFHGRVETGISFVAVLREVKFAPIGADGKYLADPVIVPVTATPGGLTQSAGLPRSAQDALAISLTTDLRGPSGKGRFYIPCPIRDLDPATMLINLAQAELTRGSAQTFLNDVNNTPGFDGGGASTPYVVVASTKGFNTTVTGVRVGRVTDTIRSRRSSIRENYTAELPVT